MLQETLDLPQGTHLDGREGRGLGRTLLPSLCTLIFAGDSMSVIACGYGLYCARCLSAQAPEQRRHKRDKT